MEPIDLISISEDQNYFPNEDKKNTSFNPIETSKKRGCGVTRRRAFAEQFGGLQALPPKWQIKREKSAIQADENFKKNFGDQKVKIRKVEGGYLVFSDSAQLKVDVTYLPRTTPGPALFELSFGKVQPYY